MEKENMKDKYKADFSYFGQSREKVEKRYCY